MWDGSIVVRFSSFGEGSSGDDMKLIVHKPLRRIESLLQCFEGSDSGCPTVTGRMMGKNRKKG
jgi:hypothetical protein